MWCKYQQLKVVIIDLVSAQSAICCNALFIQWLNDGFCFMPHNSIPSLSPPPLKFLFVCQNRNNEAAILPNLYIYCFWLYPSPPLTHFPSPPLPRYEYHWADGTTVKKPIKCSAPKYIEYLMQWVQEQLDDETIFPSKIGGQSSFFGRKGVLPYCMWHGCVCDVLVC